MEVFTHYQNDNYVSGHTRTMCATFFDKKTWNIRCKSFKTKSACNFLCQNSKALKIYEPSYSTYLTWISIFTINRLCVSIAALIFSVGNILPFAADNSTNVTAPAAPGRRKRLALLGELLGKKNGTAVSATNADCCGELNGLCAWIEPVGYRSVIGWNPWATGLWLVGTRGLQVCDWLEPVARGL